MTELRQAGRRLAAGLLFLLLPPAYAASCPGGGARPEWVHNPDTITEQHYYSAGVSHQADAPLSERLTSARQDALRNLSSMIQVEVRNALTLEQTRRQGGGTVLTESNLRSLTETSTRASLENVEAVESWEDPASCQVWVRVRVARSVLEQKRREGLARQLFTLLTEQMAAAQDAARPLDARQAALDAAQDALPRITLSLVPEASSAAYYQQQLRRLADALGTARTEVQGARKLLDDADAQLNQAADQSSEPARVRLQRAAIANYRSLLQKHPNGLAALFGPGDLYMKLGEVEELRGNACGARNYYLQAVASRQVVDRRAVAQKRAEGLSCSAADMDKALWKQYFEGRKIDLYCVHSTKPAPQAWSKACDEVGNQFRALGAEIDARGIQLPPPQAQALLQGEVPPGLGTKGRSLLAVLATGTLNTRQEGGGREYQFQGMLWTLLLDEGESVYSDRFQGATGWNPISPEMVMDVLALNVARRWQGRFTSFLRKDLPQ